MTHSALIKCKCCDSLAWDYLMSGCPVSQWIWHSTVYNYLKYNSTCVLSMNFLFNDFWFLFIHKCLIACDKILVVYVVWKLVIFTLRVRYKWHERSSLYAKTQLRYIENQAKNHRFWKVEHIFDSLRKKEKKGFRNTYFLELSHCVKYSFGLYWLSDFFLIPWSVLLRIIRIFFIWRLL